MKYREVARKLRTLGCHETIRRVRGSHRKWANPLTEGAAIIPDHGGRDLKIGTLRTAIRNLGIDWREFLKA